MTNGTKVKKRNGSIEPLNLEKMHVMVEEACKNLAGVSASQVEIQSGIQFYDGISTAEIQEILIRSASDLIDLDHVNYQYVAARLLLFSLRKQVFGRIHDHPSLIDHVKVNVEKRVYDAEILDLYSKEEFDKLQGFIDHDRDYIFTYAGLRQVVDKYLVQDRSTGELYESPQFMYLLISATIFSKYPKETRLDYVKKYYDAISKHKINIPIPDFSIDATDSTCVDTDSCPLCNITTHGHIRTKNAIQGIININENTRRILPNWCADSRHDWGGDVDFVFGNGIVILFNVI